MAMENVNIANSLCIKAGLLKVSEMELVKWDIKIWLFTKVNGKKVKLQARAVYILLEANNIKMEMVAYRNTVAILSMER
jgi:hypothetical protein